ncbi:outer membrane beta-barrel protein [Rhodoblastus acidophilus]|uniref:Outer membrane beta-barrel protein n=1 Tax=Candidatus Rhodoblastus alkanivorans TaxID=2954117 RepID=A0ABS9ZA26_9HYPH|nr:outer membrane beta-barrel protein [Candidatus Rhodoblastus alkanivorans]MCI4677186.1 outer membrane beta-barrel protein [Candidatus Rhodoblastus alkanivorans]MCI4684539.1 outer membrane beta-barrel protein [Candidatus Rhodoblastus alkanivorans]MDI4641860.1 outer membrane beta-barrel protein [Rhodoblastus acidophilus]
MGSLKALTVASAVAMFALPAAIVPAAHAADLLPPPPQLEPPPLRGPIEESGFYLRGDVGVGINEASSLNSTFGTGATLASLGAWDGPVNVGDSGVIDFGVGYQFNPWFRADLTASYISGASYNSKVFYQYTGGGSNCPVGGATTCGDNYNGQVRTALFLANGYLDVGTWMGVTPYVGGGIGFAAYGMNGVTDISMSQPNGYGLAPNYSGTNFAWDLTAGLGFHVTPNMLVDMSYRYVNMGKYSTGAIACNGGASTGCAYETQHYNMVSNQLLLGFRYLLVAPAAPPIVTAKY